MGQLGFKYLAAAIEVLQQRRAHGRLSCNQSTEQSWLYFRQGKLISATNSQGEQGEKVLYEILGWPSDKSWLEWEALAVNADPIFNPQEEKAWYEALKTLQEHQRLFSASSPLIRLAVETALDEAPKPNPKATEVSNHHQNQKLILPLGLIASAITGKVAAGELAGVLTKLNANGFSGYLRVQSQSEEPTGFSHGLLVVREGAVIQVELGLRETSEAPAGEAALEYLNRVGLNLLGVEVEPEVVEAWRALLNGQRVYNNVALTPSNYQNLLQSFASSKRSGAIHFYQEQAEFYGLIYRGNLLEIYRPESKSGSTTAYLQEIEELPENLFNKGRASLDVYLTTATQPLTLRREQLNPEDLELIERAFQAVVHLTGELASPEKITRHLQNVLQTGSQIYPPLRQLTLTREPDSNLPLLAVTPAGSTLGASPKQEVLAAFDYLFEEFLKSYCYPIGPEIFHAMAVRAINQKDARRLLELGLRLDFLTQESHPVPPGFNYVAEPASDTINPFDF
jgi:hypothetical protein